LLFVGVASLLQASVQDLFVGTSGESSFPYSRVPDTKKAATPPVKSLPEIFEVVRVKLFGML
jgi:hypothetical protein